MPRRRDPVPRARSMGHWLGGILLLGIMGGAVVAAAILLWENLDIEQLAPTVQAAEEPQPLPLPHAPPPPAAEGREFTAVLLNSDRNRAYFPDTAYYPRTLRRWRALAESVGGRVTEVGSLENVEEELGGIGAGDLLLVPEAPCLSAPELRFIRNHLDSGGNLVANWAVGARDEACEWRGWETIAQLTEAQDVRELAVREALFVTVPAGTPLSPGLDPGTRIEFLSAPALAVRKDGPRIYWSDWALNPAPDESGGGADAASSVISTEAGGRAVWFGFQLSNVATPNDSARLDRVVQNGMRWAAGIPLASVAPWPQGMRAAMSFTQDVEADYRNAGAMAQVLQEKGVPGTFFAVSQLVMEDRELAAALLAAGEVGSHSPDHTPLAGLTAMDQRLRLRRGWSDTRAWTGVEPAGLRPPEERFDNNTLQAWLDAGGEYVMGVNDARSGSPEIHRFGQEAMVLLPRLLKDDYNVFVQDGAMRGERLTEAFLEGTRKLRSIGGFAGLTLHTQILGTGARLDALRVVADTAAAQGDWWIATAKDVAAWWRQRDGVRLAFSRAATAAPHEAAEESAPDPADQEPGPSGDSPESGLWLTVQAPPAEGIQGAWVDILLPAGIGDLKPLVDGVPVSFIATELGLRVPVGDLEAGEIHEIELRPFPPEDEAETGT